MISASQTGNRWVCILSSLSNRSLLEKQITQFFKIIRAYTTPYGVLVGLCGLLSSHHNPTIEQVTATVLITLCFPASIATLNDLVHRRKDELAKRQRDYSLTLLVTIASILIFITSVSGFWSGLPTCLWLFASLLIGILYSLFKSLPLCANLLRGGITSSVVLACASIGNKADIIPLSLQIAVCLGLLDTAGNILGDVRDIEVDRRANVLTIAVRSHVLAIVATLVFHTLAVGTFTFIHTAFIALLPIGLLPILCQMQASHLVYLVIKYIFAGSLTIFLASNWLCLWLGIIFTLMVFPSFYIYKKLHNIEYVEWIGYWQTNEQ
ncbi:MAG: UbiA family prenyltransferase [Fischerella sp. CENA71]|nr:UbiA family prenyltransferase [Fischerella sp. CENA71]